MVIQENEYVDLAELDKHINPIGRVVKKPIYKKEPLTNDNTLPDLAIKRGDKVVVIASNGTVTIRGMGTAMEDGRVGETIRVKRENSKKLLTGKINESGELILGD
jgi:flagella basal body P-ring formation protein FlgA